ncbi:hypothetical protein EWM64_g9673 [Hericium alpestre]|uniref:Uncharacterized protein n=1 Tax=Hericium alpestre TaxID=135208 RepID=A0A4Y9ZLC9_9AGAM|nr:hypothetical protein EWM64_g9673 [Hericium alpestre]
MSCFEIYNKKLAALGHGVALWEPNSAGLYSSVEIGDAFPRISGHSISPHAPTVYYRVLPKGVYTSNNVFAISGGTKFSGYPLALPIDGEISLMCSKKQGAVLAISDHALREDARHRGLFKQYLRENCRSWFSFSKRLGLELGMQDLILVTGRDLTNSWAVAVFTEAHAYAKLTIGSFILGSVSFNLAWTEGSRVLRNHGPLVRRLAPGMTEIDPNQKDQCIFLRGIYSTKCLFLPFPRIMRAAAEGCDPDLNNNDPDAPSSALVNREHDSPSPPPSLTSESHACDSDFDSDDTLCESLTGDSALDKKTAITMLDDGLDNSGADVTFAYDDQIHPSLTVNQPDDGLPSLRDESTNTGPALAAELRAGDVGGGEHSSSDINSDSSNDPSFVLSSAEFGGTPSQEERWSSQKEIAPLRDELEKEGRPAWRLTDHMRARGTGVAKGCVQL